MVQLYLNKENSIKSITINDKTLNQNDLIVSEEVGLNRYQFVISSELNKTSTLKINYSTILPERTILPVAYTYNIIQQSGYAYAKKNIEINLPDSVRASAVTSKVDNLPNKIMVDLKDKNSFGFNLVSR